jgi:hypothetical protein
MTAPPNVSARTPPNFGTTAVTNASLTTPPFFPLFYLSVMLSPLTDSKAGVPP